MKNKVGIEKKFMDVVEPMIDKTLSEMEKDIIKMRYGLSGYKICSLRKIGELYNFQPSYAHVIEYRALRKLMKTTGIIGFFRTLNKKRELKESYYGDKEFKWPRTLLESFLWRFPKEDLII